MSLNRRKFIRSASALAALSLHELQALAEKAPVKTGESPATVQPDDEVYWRSLRKQFPLTTEWAYLNNGTFGPSPYVVIDAMRAAQMEADQNGNYGSYNETPPKIAKFVGADADEIALTHNVTEGINTVCWGAPLGRRDEVILTTHEHVGNAWPWMNREKLHGIVIKKYTPAATAEETLNRISDLITSRTRVIATPHIPCTQGQVLPIKDICALARDKGIFSLIDGAHGPGMMPLNLHDMGCDTYASCSHKWMLGPKGTGFLYVRKDFQDAIQDYYSGGGTDDGKWNLMTDPVTVGGYAPSAHRYFGGTQANGLFTGVNAAIDFLEGIGMQNVYERVKYLGKYTQDQLLSLGGKAELLTPTEERSRCAVNGFRVKGVDFHKFYDMCVGNKVRIRAVAENGLNSLRVSTHIYNSKMDVDMLIDVIKTA